MEMRVVKEIAQTHGKSLPYSAANFIYPSNLCATGKFQFAAHDLLVSPPARGAMDLKIREPERSEWGIVD